MISFAADDYGVSKEYNRCIETCLKNGVLNKVSVLPNGDFDGLKDTFSNSNAEFALHINLVEGRPLSDPRDIGLLTTEQGYFKYSFIGLFLVSLSPKRKELAKQLHTEIRNQIRFWKEQVGDGQSISIDSHQHAYMIPLVFKTLTKVIKKEDVAVRNLRIPSEPILPYLLAPSLYRTYKLNGIIKQWLLKFLACINRRELNKLNIPYSYFLGVMNSGKLDKAKLEKLLPCYLKIAERHGKNIEIGFHPGYSDGEPHFIPGVRESFKKFYCSPWRKVEFDTVMDKDLQTKMKEGY